MNIKLYQIDVKSSFLNGFIEGKVYVEQPPGFENFDFSNNVFKVSKALYGLKQAPRAWYERLSNFLLEKGFSKGKVDTTLFIIICLLFKYILMILFSVLLTIACVRNSLS